MLDRGGTRSSLAERKDFVGVSFPFTLSLWIYLTHRFEGYIYIYIYIFHSSLAETKDFVRLCYNEKRWYDADATVFLLLQRPASRGPFVKKGAVR